MNCLQICLGILNDLRTKYYYNIIELIPQIKLLKEDLAMTG